MAAHFDRQVRAAGSDQNHRVDLGRLTGGGGLAHPKGRLCWATDAVGLPWLVYTPKLWCAAGALIWKDAGKQAWRQPVSLSAESTGSIWSLQNSTLPWG